MQAEKNPKDNRRQMENLNNLFDILVGHIALRRIETQDWRHNEYNVGEFSPRIGKRRFDKSQAVWWNAGARWIWTYAALQDADTDFV